MKTDAAFLVGDLDERNGTLLSRSRVKIPSTDVIAGMIYSALEMEYYTCTSYENPQGIIANRTILNAYINNKRKHFTDTAAADGKKAITKMSIGKKYNQ